MRRARGSAAVVALALSGAVVGWQAHPVLALVPLVMPGMPAALMLGATLRHGDPYDLLDVPGSVGPHH